MRQSAKEAGAHVVALVNVEDSPLAQLAHDVVPLRAGPELSVAATKSYICSLSAILHIAATWRDDANLRDALFAVPDALRDGWNLDWSPLVDGLVDVRNMFVIGRGFGFGAALEAALKFKETCSLHAEAFSAAEVRHGPMAIVGRDFPVLVFAQRDDTWDGTLALAREFRERGARVWVAAPGEGDLPVPASTHPACTPLLTIQNFYRAANALVAAARLQSGRAAASAQSHGDGVMRTALVNGRVLTDAGIEDGLTVVIDGERIVEVTAARADADRTHDLQGRVLAPGFIDCQVNGGGGVLFNDEPTVEACAASRRRIAASARPACCRR